jgi:16S rRNA (adenine1518-N6/adenine1519-N6)-dimethyltransferase
MTLSEMRQLLAARDVRLTKSLGQNFLHDGNQLRKIAGAGELTPADRVLEIGPGFGPLTEVLLAQAGEVLAVEMDRRLVAILMDRFAAALQPDVASGAQSPRLTLVDADALEWLRRGPRDWTGWKMISNLPYSVASPILVELALCPRGPDRIVATLQLEVARRLVATAGADDYGLLSLLVQCRYKPVNRFKIPRGCFFPPPDVDSACITLDRRTEPPVSTSELPAFLRVVKRAFGQRRKMMLKLLRPDWPAERLVAACREAGIGERARAEEISLEQFALLARRLAGSSASS